MKSRNVLVELARFIFSILVVGYHVQMSMNNNAADFFENGALAVEFFFLISGYFLARSVEKTNGREGVNAGRETLRFMKNKVKGILPAHITAIVAIIAVILIFDFSNAASLLLAGLPSIFLVQMAAVWNHSFDAALIVPEWYLSAMLICMLFMVPAAILLRKRMRGVLVTLVLAAVLVAVMLICGFCVNWAFPQNFIYDVRAWGEMCVGMFAYYASAEFSKRQFGRRSSLTLKVAEVAGYLIPAVLGIIPLSAALQPVCMAVTVVCVFTAITVTFSGKGVNFTNDKAVKAFTYLGSLSLAIYLFHPVIITLLGYVYTGCAQWLKMIITFASTLVLAVIFVSVMKVIRNLVEKQKAKKLQFDF